MIAMFSEQEWLLFGLAVTLVLLIVLAAAFLIEVAKIAASKIFKQKSAKNENKEADEIIAVVDDDDFYEIADAALEAQRLIDFKCRMAGIDKAIRILRGDE